MWRIPAILTALACAALQSGCAIACGGSRYPSPQNLQIAAPVPTNFTIRVMAEKPIDTPIPENGRVSLDVPVFFRHSQWYLFAVMPLKPERHIERERVISILHGSTLVKRLSAAEIAKLPLDNDGYHIVEIQK